MLEGLMTTAWGLAMCFPLAALFWIGHRTGSTWLAYATTAYTVYRSLPYGLRRTGSWPTTQALIAADLDLAIMAFYAVVR